jgi:hypothetical protein
VISGSIPAKSLQKSKNSAEFRVGGIPWTPYLVQLYSFGSDPATPPLLAFGLIYEGAIGQPRYRRHLFVNPWTIYIDVLMFARAQENKMLRETVGKLEHGRSWLEERMEALEARLAALTPDLKVSTTMRFVLMQFLHKYSWRRKSVPGSVTVF